VPGCGQKRPREGAFLSILLLERHIAIDNIIGEYAAGFEEVSILVQFFQCLIQREGNLWNLGLFLGRQVVKILVHRLARMNLVLDTIEPGHHQCAEGKVGVGNRLLT